MLGAACLRVNLYTPEAREDSRSLRDFANGRRGILIYENGCDERIALYPLSDTGFGGLKAASVLFPFKWRNICKEAARTQGFR